MPGLEDYANALRFRDILSDLVKGEIEKNRPRYQYATVAAIDQLNRKCTVTFPGESGTVVVGMGSVQPSLVGQVVRVDGIGGDRYISDVLGDSRDNLAEVDYWMS